MKFSFLLGGARDDHDPAEPVFNDCFSVFAWHGFRHLFPFSLSLPRPCNETTYLGMICKPIVDKKWL